MISINLQLVHRETVTAIASGLALGSGQLDSWTPGGS
jgi:hypothetical protein